MAAFRPSAHALKRVVAGLGSELAPILSLEMAAEDVLAHRRKHATRKPVKVETFVSELCFYYCFLSLCETVFEDAAIGLVKILIATLVGCLITRIDIHL